MERRGPPGRSGLRPWVSVVMAKQWVRAALGALVVSLCLLGGTASASTHPAPPARDLAWVTAEGSVTEPGSSVTPVDLASHGVESTVRVGTLPASASLPSALAFTKNDADLLVATRGNDTLSELNPRTRRVVHHVTVGLEPDAVAVATGGPDNSALALVANLGDNTVTAVNLATWKAGLPIPVGSEPVAIAVAAGTAYVADAGSNLITPIDLATLDAGTPIAVGQSPETVAVAGAELLVGNFGNDTLTPINTATNQAARAVALPLDPTGIVVTAAGSMAYIAGGAAVVPLTVAGLAVGTPVTLRGVAEGIALGAGDKVAWVALQAGSLEAVELTSDTAGRLIHVGGHPSAVVIATS
jgi:YVTN family beta-propeller protein